VESKALGNSFKVVVPLDMQSTSKSIENNLEKYEKNQSICKNNQHTHWPPQPFFHLSIARHLVMDQNNWVMWDPIMVGMTILEILGNLELLQCC